MANLNDLMRDAYSYVNNAARLTTKNIMNDLAEAGPEWSGDFKNSWVAYSPGGTWANANVASGMYPYSLRDIVKLPATKREAERVTKYIIDNVAPHKLIAMDLIEVDEEDFIYPGYPPRGDVVARGKRPARGKRGNVVSGSGRGSANATSTAPLDWYTIYLKGGKIRNAIQKGVQLAKPE